ncbi:MAG: ABC transporter substrate-binding protein [Alteraurantiacibacter sp.]
MAVLLLAGCTQPQPPRVDGPRPTIVSLNPCTDAILAEVAAPGQLLAISHYSKDPVASSMLPAQAARYRATGGSVEEVLALDPDLVVAGRFLDPAARRAFERLGIRVETVGTAQTVGDSVTQVRALAGAIGQSARGEALAERITTAWANASTPGPPVPTLLWQQGGVVPGSNSLIAQLLERSGFSLQSAARGLAQGAYLPLEQVLADPPALVLSAADEPMLRHPVLARVPGLRYETFDPALLYCGGPSIPRALARLRAVREGER